MTTGSVLATFAARIQAVLSERRWKKTAFAHGKVSPNTVRHVLHGKNARLSTLIDMADALDCDLVIDLKPRPVIDGIVEYPQHIAHEK